MASGTSGTHLVATRYASALLELAEGQKLADKIEADMLALEAAVKDSEELRSFIANPLMGKSKQRDAVFAIAEKAKLQQLTGNFLGVLIDNSRLAALPHIIARFKVLVQERRGAVTAQVTSAFALTKTQEKTIQKELSDSLGSEVALEVSVDEALLGGMAVTIGSRMIDYSVRRKLERLQRAMYSGSNENQTQLKEVG